MRMLVNGEVDIPKNLMVYMVSEEVKPSEMSAIDKVLSVDTERVALMAKLKEVEDREEPNLELMEKLNERLEEIDADSAEVRAAEILAGLGFDSFTM